MSQPAETSKALESEVFKSKYRLIKAVGKGSFGEAVLVRSKVDGRRYIAKAIESAAMTAKEKRDVQNEIVILARLNHTNIVRYLEHFEDGTLIFIVMEYADGGDLNNRIKEQKKKEPVALFDPKLAMFWFLQICMALKYLHDNHILHRDLKTANVFLTTKNIVKLGDFGISTILQNTLACAKTVCGTPYYFSPELCQSKPYNNKSDVWALGVVFYETLTLQRPFNAKSLKELLKKILVGQYEPIPASVPAEMRTLCASLLNINPSQRPSVNRIIESPFVQDQLKGFSAQLEAETAKEAAEAASKPAPAPPQQQTPAVQQQQAPPPQQKVLSAAEQMAMLRSLGRDGIKAMAQQQSTQIQQEMEAQKRAPVGGAPAEREIENDDDDHVAQKQKMIQQTRAIVGKPLADNDDFGDADQGGNQVETITMANGQSVPANQVHGLLVAELGAPLLAKALDYVSNILSSPSAPSNQEIQRELSALVGAKFAHHSNAIAKLAVWEGKQ